MRFLWYPEQSRSQQLSRVTFYLMCLKSKAGFEIVSPWNKDRMAEADRKQKWEPWHADQKMRMENDNVRMITSWCGKLNYDVLLATVDFCRGNCHGGKQQNSFPVVKEEESLTGAHLIINFNFRSNLTRFLSGSEVKMFWFVLQLNKKYWTVLSVSINSIKWPGLLTTRTVR